MTIRLPSLGEQWTIPLFACITSQEDEVDSVLSSVGIDSGLLSDPLSRAALRLLWRRCRQTLDQPATAKLEVVTAPGSSDSSWSETFPPKLSHEAFSTLKQDLSSRYPSELLDRDNIPNQRVMAWLHRNSQEKHWRPCAWRFRLSSRQQEERDLGPRFAKRSKLALSKFLIADVPTRDIGPQLGICA